MRNWNEMMKALRRLFEEKNNSCWRNEINSSNSDMKRLWWLLHSVLGKAWSEQTDAHSAAIFCNDKINSVQLRR